MAGLTAIKRIGFAGGGRDSSTRAASKGSGISTRSYSTAEKKDQQRTRETNQRIRESERGQQQTANTQAAINRAQSINVPKEKKKINIPSFKNIYDGYNKFRYNTVNSLIPGQKERIEKYRKAYAKYLNEQGIQVPENLLDEDLSSYFFNGAFDKNVNFEGASGKGINTDYMDYGTFMATKMGSPHIKYSGNVGGIGDKYVTKYEILADGSKGKPLEYGYTNIDESGNRIFTGGEGGGQNYLPLNYGVGVGTANTDDVAEETTFDYRFGNDQKVGRDVTLGYAANGGRITRAGGGIMNAVPRQGYFLGKIVKGVGKAIGSVADAAGKVLKSDLGKAAVLGLGAYYMPGFGIKATGGFSNMFQPSGFFGKALLNKGAKDFALKNINPLKFAGLLTLGGALAGPAKQDTLPDSGTRGGRLLDSQGNEVLPAGIRSEIDQAYESGDPEQIKRIEDFYAFLPPRNMYLPYPNYAVGGRVAAQEGGLMDLGGMEKDYRNEGGFVPIGREEKADDVPARLSVNEFVFTADAVRNAGGGDIDKGAEVMENMMKNLENGGRVSEESQGNAGAQEMFSVSERIGEVI